MRTRILPYKRGSKSAKALAEEMGVLRLKLTGSKFTPRANDRVINWGMSVLPARLSGGTIVNQPLKVSRASNKLSYFNHMAEVEPDLIPEFWLDSEDIPEDAYPVVCRQVLNGHSGAGIVIADDPEGLVDAPLYVKYVPKKHEYRIHVADGEVISVQRKARLRSVADEDVDWRVRNHSNGFIFARHGIEVPDSVKDAAVRTLAAMELDFGAMDIVYNEREEKPYVLEVNTAPGLEGSTVQDYANHFNKRDEADRGGA